MNQYQQAEEGNQQPGFIPESGCQGQKEAGQYEILPLQVPERQRQLVHCQGDKKQRGRFGHHQETIAENHRADGKKESNRHRSVVAEFPPGKMVKGKKRQNGQQNIDQDGCRLPALEQHYNQAIKVIMKGSPHARNNPMGICGPGFGGKDAADRIGINLL